MKLLVMRSTERRSHILSFRRISRSQPANRRQLVDVYEAFFLSHGLTSVTADSRFLFTFGSSVGAAWFS